MAAAAVGDVGRIGQDAPDRAVLGRRASLRTPLEPDGRQQPAAEADAAARADARRRAALALVLGQAAHPGDCEDDQHHADRDHRRTRPCSRAHHRLRLYDARLGDLVDR
jgi:hypothetical protein